MKCSICGGERWSVVGRVGALETWRCLECTREETVHVNVPLSEADLPVTLEPVFHLLVEWTSTPAARDIGTFQALFPRVKGVTFAAMVRAARERKRIDVGRFTESELRPMASTLESLSLVLHRVPVTAGVEAQT